MSYFVPYSLAGLILALTLVVSWNLNLKSLTNKHQAKVYRVYTGPLAHLPGPEISKWTSLVLLAYLLSGNRPRYVQKLHLKYGMHIKSALLPLTEHGIRAYCSNQPG
jgi:hypothetical protein